MVAQKPELGDSRSAQVRPDFNSPNRHRSWLSSSQDEPVKTPGPGFLYRKKLHDGGSNFQMQTQTLLPQLGVPT
ncbi:hypothetical protein THARTR1_04412 [Trichoderma harzianum]|uniref:Uncharacterized protein n=1 Tax=Trichoderma harzianum TaxID=5544 RepID=A0A2K0UBW4_TRIHA|nr:hypothetical protein THARTR1_04412 [Trichoderma harzianum]